MERYVRQQYTVGQLTGAPSFPRADIVTLAKKDAPKGGCHWVTLKDGDGGKPHHVCIAGARKTLGLFVGPFDEKTNPLWATSLDDMIKRVEGMTPGHQYSGIGKGMAGSPHSRGYYDPRDATIHLGTGARSAIRQMVARNTNPAHVNTRLTDKEVMALGTLVHEMGHTSSPVTQHVTKFERQGKIQTSSRIYGGRANLIVEEGINELRTRKALAQMVQDRTGQKKPLETIRDSYQMEFSQWAWFEKKFGDKRIEEIWKKNTAEKRALEINKTVTPYLEKSLSKVLTPAEMEKAKKGWTQLSVFPNNRTFNPTPPAWALMASGFMTEFERQITVNHGGKTPSERRSLRYFAASALGLDIDWIA